MPLGRLSLLITNFFGPAPLSFGDVGSVVSRLPLHLLPNFFKHKNEASATRLRLLCPTKFYQQCDSVRGPYEIGHPYNFSMCVTCGIVSCNVIK